MARALTIGDISGYLQLAKAGVLGIAVTDFGVLFTAVRGYLNTFKQLTPEIDAALTLAATELRKNPLLFEIGKTETAAKIDELIKKYPAGTLLSDIPEFAGGSAGGPVVTPGPKGIDIAALTGLFKDIKVDFDPKTKTIHVEGGGYKVDLGSIERVKFNDGTLYLDFEGVGGQAYRIYQAVFDRVPDSGGLKYWIGQLDQTLTLQRAAELFMGSAEFKQIYGTNPTHSDFVNRLYQNVLDRAGEKSGIDYWTGRLGDGSASRVDVLIGFSESIENKDAVFKLIPDGFFL